jgi:predicted RNA-binding Zn-ribbon protein involved in translation (DUF1610 family)
MKDILRSQFDEIIGQNFERLTGTRQGIGGLPLNIATIGCFILLGGREIEIENSPADADERYTRETFLHEAAGLGVEPDEYLETGLRDMIERGYFEVDSEGRIIAQESTMAMTRVLDRIFPKMTGINLLAYIGQTVEEAMTGRTDMESATSRFDQTLKHQGVPFSAQKSSNASLSTSIDLIPQETRMSRDEILAELYSRAKTSEPHLSANTRPNRVLAGGGVLRSLEVDDILPKDENPPEISCDAEAEEMEDTVDTASRAQDALVSPFNIRDMGDEIEITSTPEEPRISGVEVAVSETEQITPAILQDSSPNDERAELIHGKDEDAPVDEKGTDESSPDDDAIADKIAAFEKDLSFTCPICKTNILNEQSTATGKKYYTCPSSVCNFISWGKPHHVECRRCKNPFLIEVADASGEIILKCPRATCQHRQGLNPKLVKVVRKRVVRRKR